MARRPPRGVETGPARNRHPASCYSRTFLDKHLLDRIGDEPLIYIDVPRVLEVRAQLIKDRVPDYTAARSLKLLRQVLHFAVLSGRLSANPADILRAKGMLPAQGRKREIRPLLPAEVEAIRRAMLARQTDHALRDATLVSVLGYAGLRPSEALRLTWEDVREDSLRVAAGKTGKPRTVPKLIAPLMADLAEWRASPNGSKLVFPGDDGRAWTDTAYGNWRNRAWKECAPAANVIYDLRHGYSLMLAREGVQVSDAAKRMGHKPATHLAHYEHFLDDLREQHAEPLEAVVKKCRISAASCDTEGYEAVALAA
jgi:integrase